MRLPAILPFAVLCLLAGCNRYEPATATLDAGRIYLHQTGSAGSTTWTNDTPDDAQVGGYEVDPNTAGFTATPVAASEAVPARATSSAVAVSFTPTVVGPASAKLKPLVTKPDLTGFPGKVVKVKLAGVGVAQIQATGLRIGSQGVAANEFLDFGSAQVAGGGQPAGRVEKTITLTNRTMSAMAISVAMTGTPFTAASTTVTVPANSSVDLKLTFSPPAVGEHWGVVGCTDAGGTVVVGMVLKGTGVAADGH